MSKGRSAAKIKNEKEKRSTHSIGVRIKQENTYCNHRHFRTQKILYPSVRELSYTINFRTVRVVLHTLLYVHGFRMLLNFLLSAKVRKVRN